VKSVVGGQTLFYPLYWVYMLGSEKITRAFKKVDRKDFVRPSFAPYAYEDIPLSIGYGQTISQPSTVVFMFELLVLKSGLKVLDVGFGSGWTTALLAQIVGAKGEVVGVEIVPELVDFGRKNISKYCEGLNVSVFLAKEELGYPLKAPYDRILVSASGNEIPVELIKQLKVGGIMVIPVLNSIWKVVRKSANVNDVFKEEYPGFVFVPLKK